MQLILRGNKEAIKLFKKSTKLMERFRTSPTQQTKKDFVILKVELFTYWGKIINKGIELSLINIDDSLDSKYLNEVNSIILKLNQNGLSILSRKHLQFKLITILTENGKGYFDVVYFNNSSFFNERLKNRNKGIEFSRKMLIEI